MNRPCPLDSCIFSGWLSWCTAMLCLLQPPRLDPCPAAWPADPVCDLGAYKWKITVNCFRTTTLDLQALALPLPPHFHFPGISARSASLVPALALGSGLWNPTSRCCLSPPLHAPLFWVQNSVKVEGLQVPSWGQSFGRRMWTAGRMSLTCQNPSVLDLEKSREKWGPSSWVSQVRPNVILVFDM